MSLGERWINGLHVFASSRGLDFRKIIGQKEKSTRSLNALVLIYFSPQSIKKRKNTRIKRKAAQGTSYEERKKKFSFFFARWAPVSLPYLDLATSTHTIAGV